jgi:DNA-binding Lrp family transcriptional regulator
MGDVCFGFDCYPLIKKVGVFYIYKVNNSITLMDETDTKILKRLLADARSSYRKIAFEIGVSPPTVLNRITRLERDNIIKSYSAIVDHVKLGFDLTAVIEITAIKNKINDVEKHISKLPNVCAVYDITGLTDMIIVAKFKNRRELSDFVKRDLSLPYVDRTNTHIVLITVKEDFRLL